MIADPTDHHRRPIGRARLRPPGAMAPVDAILSAPFKYGMLDLGLQSVIRGKPVRTTISDKAAPCPLGQVNRQFCSATILMRRRIASFIHAPEDIFSCLR